MIRLLVKDYVDGRGYIVNYAEKVIVISKRDQSHFLWRWVRTSCRVDIVGIDCDICTLAILTLPRSAYVGGKLTNKFLSCICLTETEGTSPWIDRDNFSYIDSRRVRCVPFQGIK